MTDANKPVDCAPTCANISLCEHGCVGYKYREPEWKPLDTITKEA